MKPRMRRRYITTVDWMRQEHTMNANQIGTAAREYHNACTVLFGARRLHDIFLAYDREADEGFDRYPVGAAAELAITTATERVQTTGDALRAEIETFAAETPQDARATVMAWIAEEGEKIAQSAQDIVAQVRFAGEQDVDD